MGVLLGHDIGKWEAIEFVSEAYRKSWRCRCSCGSVKLVRESYLLKGKSKSCGCRRIALAKQKNLSHGMSGTDIYRVWRTMKARCTNPNNKRYYRYGGRGISVCDEWASDFSVFHEWATKNGYVKGLEIDRIDNDGNYEPSNCRFVTKVENSNNRSTNRFVTIDGITKTIAQWAREVGIDPRILRNRLLKGETSIQPVRGFTNDRNRQAETQ